MVVTISDWKRISIIRAFITEMLSLEVTDLGDAKNISTATSELIENTVKYSAISGAVVSIKKDIDHGKMRLAISNITTTKQLTLFESILTILHEGTPKEVYRDMMLRSFNHSEKCQLGLARIQYECQGKISYSVSDNLSPILSLDKENETSTGLKLLTVTAEIPITFL